MFDITKNPFFQPQVALIVFVAILVGYLIFLDKEDTFQKKFLRFGPSPDSKFLNINLDTWGKVIAVYIISFISALSTSYYKNITGSFVSGVLLNPAYNQRIDHSKWWARILVSVDPLITSIMSIIQIFVSLIMEFQYLLPQIIGGLLVTIPYNLINLSTKKFSTD
jgi:hypothetical protein